MPAPIARPSVPDLVVAHLREAILTGRYAPGEPLPTQRTLAAEFRVNIASIREALKRLEQLRLVEIRHGQATRVLDWRSSGGLEALAVLGAVDPEVITALFEARRLLLAQAARLAAGRRTEEQARRLSELAHAFSVAPDHDPALLVDWEFMSTVVEAAGNLVFSLIMNSVRQLYLPNLSLFRAVVSGYAELAPIYARAAQAIADRDPDAAEAALAELAGRQERQVRGE
jgi:DNA-binding FadR family transcriptional regulator